MHTSIIIQLTAKHKVLDKELGLIIAQIDCLKPAACVFQDSRKLRVFRKID